MKKMFVLIACLLALCLSACGGEESEADLMITRAPQESGAAETSVVETEAPQEGVLAFVYEGVNLVPGQAFDPSVLPASESVYQVPSCAIEGTDNVYNYGSFELTAFDDGTGEVIYSMLLIDPNIATTEGLSLGDDLEKVTSLYGQGYTQEGTALIFQRGETLLYLIMQNDTVASIEYRMAA